MSFNRCGKTHSIHIPCKAHNEQLDHSIHHHYNKELLLVIRSLACLLACEWVRSAWSSSSYAIIITIISTSIQICESWCGCKVSSHSPLPQAQPPLSGHHRHQRHHRHHHQRYHQHRRGHQNNHCSHYQGQSSFRTARSTMNHHRKSRPGQLFPKW